MKSAEVKINYYDPFQSESEWLNNQAAATMSGDGNTIDYDDDDDDDEKRKRNIQ